MECLGGGQQGKAHSCTANVIIAGGVYLLGIDPLRLVSDPHNPQKNRDDGLLRAINTEKRSGL